MEDLEKEEVSEQTELRKPEATELIGAFQQTNNNSDINLQNSSNVSPLKKVTKSRRNNLSQDMNDLSVIVKKFNNSDSLNQTNIELIRKLQS